MHRSLLTVLACFVLTGADAAAGDLDRLAWLGGCWQAEGGEAGSGEHWLPPAGRTMFGVSRTVREGRTVEFEFMQIRETEEGRLVFVALPSGQETTAFPLLRLDDAEVVFENPRHDFPQRVAYRLEGRSRLRARIEGLRDGALRVVEFPMTRVSCDPPARPLQPPES